MKSKVTLTAVFVAVLIVGSTLSVILTVALTSGSVINNTPKPKVVYYAMYLGDGGGEKRISRNARSILQADNEQCSLELNKKNTISSINDMKSTNQLYSFILYTTTAKSTEPKKAMEAIRKLEGEPADSSKKEFNQTAALDKFLEEKTASDVLVFYIPCNYDYSQSDEDAKAFVKKLQDSGAGAATMLVSNTMNRTAVAKAYNISESDVAVVGQGENIADKIAKFANTTSSTTATTVSSRTTSAGVTSTASPSTTPASTSSETIVTTVSTSSEAPITTSREDVGSTTSPIASESTPGTSPTEGISTASSISEETTTEAGPTTSSSIKTSSSASAATTTTSGETEPTSGTTNSTTVVTTKLSEPTEGSDSTVASSTVLPTSSSTEEVLASTSTPESPTETSTNASTPAIPSSSTVEESTSKSSSTEFSPPATASTTAEVTTTTTEAPTNSTKRTSQPPAPPTSASTEVTTSTTTEAPANSTKRTSQPPAPPTSTSTEVANSTTTEAATTSTEKRSQPTAVPTNTSSEATTPAKSTTTSLEIKTQPTSPPTTSSTEDATNSTTTTDIATVASTTSETLPPPTSTTTVAATTTAEFTTTMEENATSPTAGATTSTTVSTTTTVPPRKRIICVFVADAYNFGKNSTPYIQERYLIGNMSDYFFKSTVEPKAGIAKYGYVKSFSVSTALSALKDRQEDFFKVIDTDPEDISALPFDTADAIKRINRFDNVKGRANSLIFISAQKDTEKLPKLQPKSKEWERIVAVGFDDTDLTNVTDKDRGVVVSIPYNFSEDDVKKVIDALLEGFHTSTTTLAPTAAAEAPAQSSPVPIDTSTDTDQTQVVNEDKGAAVKTPYAFTTTVVKKVIDTLLEVF